MKRLLATIAIATLTVPALALVVAVPAQAGGGCHGGSARDARGVNVALAKNCFDPLVVRVAVGQRVIWTNRDGIDHTVSGAAERWGNHDTLTKGKSVAWKFDKAGVFPYYCDVHPGMIGAVVVGDGLSAETTQDDVGASVVSDAQPPAAAPPAAEIDTKPAASDSGNAGPMIAALLALAAAIVIGALVLLVRRTPQREPHPLT